MARSCFHLHIRLTVQFLLTQVRAWSKMVIVHNCFSTPAICIRISEHRTTVISTFLWVKSYLQMIRKHFLFHLSFMYSSCS